MARIVYFYHFLSRTRSLGETGRGRTDEPTVVIILMPFLQKKQWLGLDIMYVSSSSMALQPISGLGLLL
jgi:hypothetical protein